MFEDNVFRIPLKLEVKRKPLIESGIIYSNYKVKMEVSFYHDDAESAVSTDYFIYTLAKIMENF